MQEYCKKCGGKKTDKNPLCRQCYRDSVARTYSFVCRYCGKVFVPKNSIYSKYCSTICSRSAKARLKQEHLDHKAEIKEKGKICQTCGMIFHPNDWHQNFCSLECKKNKRKKGYKADNKRRKIIAKETAIPKGYRICQECGREFQPVYGEKLKIFCSKRCQRRNTRRNVEHTKRERIRKQKGNPVYKHEIFLRDGGKCQICGKKVLANKKVPNPYSPTYDHIIPLSKGGIHDPKNVRLTHFVCNLKKHDRQSKDGDQLRLL